MTQVLTFVFFAFVTAKEQSQFPAVNLSLQLNENAKIKDISLDQSEDAKLEVIPESQKETPSQTVDVNTSDEDAQKNNLLLAITPEGGCVGIKVKYGMPESFDSEHSHQEWLKEAAERAIDLKYQIESGACSVESAKDKLDMKPKLDAAAIDELVAASRAGLCFTFLLFSQS